VQRRDFLAASIAAVVAGRASVRAAGAVGFAPPLAHAANFDGGAGLALTAAPGTYDLGAGPRAGAMLFNGQWPAPTITLQQGEDLDLELHNQLGEATIVHWHGLRPPADMDGHPILAIPHGASRPYLFTVDERPGTYWYHSHPHHRTAYQAYHGLAGFLLVHDGLDELRGLPTGARDLALLLADKRLDAGGNLVYQPTMADMMRGFLGNAVLVNGTLGPQQAVEPAVLRLRLLNGSNARILNPAFADGRNFWLVATDAGLLDAPIAVSSVLLSPGERIEILVDLRDDAGQAVDLVSAPFTITSPGPAIDFPQGAGFDLLRFDVVLPLAGAPGDIPAAFEPMPPPAATDAPRRDFILTQSAAAHFINGLTYELERIDFSVTLGQPEIWRFVNNGNQPHPMHMHAAHFRVLQRSGPAIATDAGWKDTVLVRVGETVDVVLRFDVPGLFLLHCHNLEHEDEGMMLNFVVVDPANSAPVAGELPDQDGREEEDFSCATAAAFSDPDGDVLAFSATGLPPSLSIDATSGVISGRPVVGDAGSHAVVVAASDGELQAQAGFTLRIAAANAAPVAGSLPDRSVRAGEPVVIDTAQAFSDPDGDVLSFSSTGLPASLLIHPATGQILGLPLEAEVGRHAVVVTASDGTLAASTGFELTIRSAVDRVFADGFEGLAR
jgi:FtsP/CotA-like multicopper oxidase with cupredoxin domain